MSRSRSAERRGTAPSLLNRRWRQRWRAIGAVLWLLALGHALRVLPEPALTRLDNLLQDARVRLAAPAATDPRIVVVEVDEQALAAEGRWPWQRRRMADLVETITGAGGARLVALDTVLAEPDNSGGLAALDAALATGPLARDTALRDAVAALRPLLDGDAFLATTIARSPVVLGFNLSNEPGAADQGVLPPPWANEAALGNLAADWTVWRGHSGNLAALQRAARLGGGHLNADIDDDGMVRRMPLLVRHSGQVHPTLALAILRADLALAAEAPQGAPPAPVWRLLPNAPPAHGLWLQQGARQLTIPLGVRAMVQVPYRASGAITRLSAADVLGGRLPADALRGKLVLVGVSVPGLVDQHRTPVDAAMPGTVVHAHLLSGLLDGRVRVLPADAVLIEAAWLLIVGGALLWWLPRLRLRRAVLVTTAVLALLLAGQMLAWQQLAWALPLAGPLALPVLLLALHGLLIYQAASGARHHLQRLFGQYVPPELVVQMARAPERYTMRSRQAELTVLFADVRGFTTLAEKMPPDELSAMMNLMFSRLTDTIRAHRGTLDKYIGDCVMAFWGAPLDDPDHARHAVDAALAMRAQLPALHEEFRARGWPALDIGIGVDTGLVVVGDMGSRHRLSYTVLGDTVNRAARLQDLASKQRLGLVVGDATRQAVGDGHCFIPLGPVALRGRDNALPAWQPLPQRPGENPAVDDRCANWARLLAFDSAGDRTQAEQLLTDLEARTPDCARCALQRQRWAVAG